MLVIRTTVVVAFPAFATPSLAQAGPQPTATEVFHLRSECAALGEKLLNDIGAKYRSVYDVSFSDQLSHYNSRINRCYIN